MHTDLIIKAVLDLQPRWQALLGDEGAIQAQSLLHLAEEAPARCDEIANLLLALFEARGARDALQDEIPPMTQDPVRLLFKTLPGDPGPVAALGTRYHCPEPCCKVTWTPQLAGQRVPTCEKHPDRRLVEG